MRSKLFQTLAAVTLAVALPLGLATQASARPVALAKPAARTAFGCVVTPLAPTRVFSPNFNHRSANYPTYAWCHNGLRVFVQDRQFVRNRFTNFATGVDFWNRWFPSWPHVINRVHFLPGFLHGTVGTYHKVRFQVRNGNVTSPWTFWDTSPTTWIP